MGDPHFDLCVIPAAGNATRMGAHCATTPKCLLEVAGQPILWHIIRYWERYCSTFAVVVRPQDVTMVRDNLFDMPDQHGLVVQVVPQPPERAGVNEAILTGLRFMRVPEAFLVVLGDCLFDGTLDWYGFDPSCHHGVVTMDGDTDWARSYGVEVHGDGTVLDLAEKPRFGCGAYALRWTAVVELERVTGITDAVAMLAHEETVRQVPFVGRYLNLTYPEDLRRWA